MLKNAIGYQIISPGCWVEFVAFRYKPNCRLFSRSKRVHIEGVRAFNGSPKNQTVFLMESAAKRKKEEINAR